MLSISMIVQMVTCFLILGFTFKNYAQNHFNVLEESCVESTYSSQQIGFQLGHKNILQKNQAPKTSHDDLADLLNIHQNIIVYPNPTKADVFLEIPITKQKIQYRLFNTLGVCLIKNEITDEKTILPTAVLSTGFYYLALKIGNTPIKTFKLIKE